jgi:hypothetical protein
MNEARERLDNLLIDLEELTEKIEADPRTKKWQQTLHPVLSEAFVDLQSAADCVVLKAEL